MAGPLRWLWDTVRQIFRGDDGEELDRAELIGQVDAEAAQSMARIESWTRQVLRGDMPTAVWERRMREEVRNQWMQNAIWGRGGQSQMTQADWGMVGGHISHEYQLLREFAEKLANGHWQEGQEGLVIVYARMYGQGARRLFFKAELQSRIEAGYTEMQRVLGAKDDGNCDDCVALAGFWAPIGSLPVPGDGSACSCGCRCSVKYR